MNLDKLVNLVVNSLLIKWINSFLVNRTKHLEWWIWEPLKVAYLPRYCTQCTQTIVKPLTHSTNCLNMQMTQLLWFFSIREGLDREKAKFIQTKEMEIDFRRNKIPLPPTKINGESVHRVTTYKYLGIEIYKHLKFNGCAFAMIRKLQQRMFFECKLNHFNVDRHILQMFYKSVLHSLLSFGLICVFGNMGV